MENRELEQEAIKQARFLHDVRTKNDKMTNPAYYDGARDGYIAGATTSSTVKELEKVKKILHELTPGGSEFYNDPEYCAKWVRENREENHYALANQIKELKNKNEELQREVERLKDVLIESKVVIIGLIKKTSDRDYEIEYANKVVKVIENNL